MEISRLQVSELSPEHGLVDDAAADNGDGAKYEVKEVIDICTRCALWAWR